MAIVLPEAIKFIVSLQEGADHLRKALTETLLYLASTNKHQAVCHALALDEMAQAIFEPLLLALKAIEDPSILNRIAREKRDLVLDVVAKIKSG